MRFENIPAPSPAERQSENAEKIGLNAAAREWARITGGRRPDRSTIQRWLVKGCRGQRLAGSRDGGQWATTVASLREFHSRLNASVPNVAVPVARAAEVQRAFDELDAITGVAS